MPKLIGKGQRLAHMMRGRTDYCMADWTKAMVSDNPHFTGKIKAI